MSAIPNIFANFEDFLKKTAKQFGLPAPPSLFGSGTSTPKPVHEAREYQPVPPSPSTKSVSPKIPYAERREEIVPSYGKPSQKTWENNYHEEITRRSELVKRRLRESGKAYGEDKSFP